MAKHTASREAVLHTARATLADLKGADWQADPAYWVGRLQGALADVLRATDTTVPTAEGYETGGCGAVDADDLDACGHCSDCTGS